MDKKYIMEIVEKLRKNAFKGPTMEAVHLDHLDWKAADIIEFLLGNKE